MRDHLTDAVMPFGEHLEELRRRLILALVGLLPIFVVSLVFGQSILEFMIRPLLASQAASGMPQKMQAIRPLETFNTYLRVSFVATVVVGAPWALYQLWLFVAPGLYLKERRFVHILAPMSALLSLAGTVFMFKVMLPIMLSFLVTFGTGFVKHDVPTAERPPAAALPAVPVLETDPPSPAPGQHWLNPRLKTLRLALPGDDGRVEIYEMPLTKNAVIEPLFTVSDYTSLILGMTLAFAVAFQMPVVVLLLGWVGIVQPAVLGRYRRHAIFACGLVGAVVTPTGDPLSMFLLAGPLYALYELGVVMLRLLPASRVVAGAERRAAREARAARATPADRPADDAEPVAAVGAPHRAQGPVAPASPRREPDGDDDES
jgi:sec-independent protein translocase protein TatC